MNAPSGLALLHRYLFYGWLFRDASVGTSLERAAALEYNRRQSRWLPTYVVRWLAIACLLLSVARFCESTLASPLLSAPFYLFSTLIIAFDAVTLACWALLRSRW
jgi:hypothetical protein